jgi:hypothetical protein
MRWISLNLLTTTPTTDKEGGGEPARISQGCCDWTSSRPTTRKAGCRVHHGCHDTTRSSVPRDATHTTLRPPLAVHALAVGVGGNSELAVITSHYQNKTSYGDRFTCIAGNQKQQITGSRVKKLQKQIIQNRNNKSSRPPRIRHRINPRTLVLPPCHSAPGTHTNTS